MSEIARLLRLKALADKEFITQSVEVNAAISGEVFTSGLTGNNSRKRMLVHNRYLDASGEVYLGASGVTPATGMLIPKGEWTEVPISTNLDIYFVSDDPGAGEIRIMELA